MSKHRKRRYYRPTNYDKLRKAENLNWFGYKREALALLIEIMEDVIDSQERSRSTVGLGTNASATAV